MSPMTLSPDRIREGLELAERLRAGLEGVTPGPWESFEAANSPRYLVQSRRGPLVADCGEAANTYSARNANHIGNTQPKNIALLLDLIASLSRERDEARADNKRLRERMVPFFQSLKRVSQTVPEAWTITVSIKDMDAAHLAWEETGPAVSLLSENPNG
jgi:hypothetical protein